MHLTERLYFLIQFKKRRYALKLGQQCHHLDQHIPFHLLNSSVKFYSLAERGIVLLEGYLEHLNDLKTVLFRNKFLVSNNQYKSVNHQHLKYIQSTQISQPRTPKIHTINTNQSS